MKVKSSIMVSYLRNEAIRNSEHVVVARLALAVEVLEDRILSETLSDEALFVCAAQLDRSRAEHKAAVRRLVAAADAFSESFKALNA